MISTAAYLVNSQCAAGPVFSGGPWTNPGETNAVAGILAGHSRAGPGSHSPRPDFLAISAHQDTRRTCLSPPS